jgi:predicted RNA-binding Zn-ribbon protein involved in translation (DUF1610 family)
MSRKVDKEIGEMLEMIFRQAQMQFGSAIKSRWLHAVDGCPGCGKEINVTKYKKKNCLSLNAYIYREHGVLIAYLLCSNCANQVIRATSNLPLHAEIEKNLKTAFVKHLGH